MIAPAVEIYDLIANENYSWLDDIVIGQRPNDVSEQKTTLRITDSVQTPTFHHSNRPVATLAGEEIQIFFKKEALIEPYEIRTVIENLLMDNGWLLSSERPQYLDPDTEQITMTFFVMKKIRRN
ncbi:DUF806 family protein [Lactobacillus gigeriorum]|uniref:Uncharacterized protein n=1 Tax=Lactobacillus gigeriorum DSM 23908 = CRBIP 24.85 TaxID=1423751 RepID=I7KNX8_9LACO|nr:DUF806 family protein [Lactobacillus gigeriorum]KRN12007.1 hypothetical protein FC38_GL000410 [Lactobacillus gigeriorum DSM 23908 = CRBIP 24.85]CCI86979.1 Predicted protein [Lactobacillus gigeriorum DSM 23908 = CRBIP 24.85]